MLNTFENKIAVITGAANGIGAALAHGFARQGMTVVVADLDAAGAQKTATSIGSAAIANKSSKKEEDHGSRAESELTSDNEPDDDDD